MEPPSTSRRGADIGQAEIEIEIDVDAEDVSLEDAEEAAPPPRASVIGATLSDRYRIDALLAEGGMGCVYRGEHVLLAKNVAIKLLRPEVEGFPDLALRFQREAIAGAHVVHPNVAAATDFGTLPDGTYFLVLELVEGTTLRERMKQGPIEPREAALIARDLAAALGACHERGIVHRDVKPTNVMLGRGGRAVKLIDFGLAKIPKDARRKEGDVELTKRAIALKGIVFGTIAYLAPEAAQGMEAIDARSDLYALGVVFYEMLAGAHPFAPKGEAALFHCHRTVPPPPIASRAVGVRVPAELEAIAMKLLAKDPNDRYASADEVARAIDDALAGSLTVADPETLDATSAPIEQRGADAPDEATTILVPPSPAPSLPSLSSSTMSAVRTHGRAGAFAGFVAIAVALGSWLTIAEVRRTSSRSLLAEPSLALAAKIAARVPEVATAPLAKAPDREPALAPIRRRFRAAANAKNWAGAGDALLALSSIEDASLEPTDVPLAGLAVEWLEFGGDKRGDPALDALATKLGSSGLDALYEIVDKKGGSLAAKRAAEILERPETRARASAALRIALELRDARCDDKSALFDRAAEEGDERALELLERLRGVRCSAALCCYLKNDALNAACDRLKRRLGD